MEWKLITDVRQVDQVIQDSDQRAKVIFKHSTSCSISTMAKLRVESKWHELSQNVDFHLLDLLAYRPVSNYIAQILDVHHESPQVILIKHGEAMYDASHFDISIEDLSENLSRVYG